MEYPIRFSVRRDIFLDFQTLQAYMKLTMTVGVHIIWRIMYPDIHRTENNFNIHASEVGNYTVVAGSYNVWQ